MRIIIIGLGNFGRSLAINLMNNNHEVFGIDNNIEKVNYLKDHIQHVICMDATNETAYKELPMQQTDLAIVAIGENEGSSIVSTAILKKYKHLRIISRLLSNIHETILKAMGVSDLVHPEQDAALRLAKRISFNYALDYFPIDNKNSIAEVVSPKIFNGKLVKDLDLTKKYKVSIITIMHQLEKTSTKKVDKKEVKGLITGKTILQNEDILVLFGENKSIMKFIKNTSYDN